MLINYKLVVIEDEDKIARMIKDYLEEEGFVVFIAKVGTYYIRQGSWDGLENILFRPSRGKLITTPVGHEGGKIYGILPGESLLLADQKGRIILDSQDKIVGEKLSGSFLDRGTPLIIESERVGTLILQPQTSRAVLTLEEQFSHSVIFAVFWGGLVALLAGAILSFLLSGHIARPLALLTSSAKKFARRDFRHRLELKRKDEIGNLAEAFNFMAESIEKNEKLRSNLMTDVSHELRTPLTILRGNFEALQAEKIKPTPDLLSSLYDEVLRLGRLVSDLEAINLAEAGKLPLHHKQVDVDDLLSRAAYVFQHEAIERRIKFVIEVAEDINNWILDEDRIMQVLINLLANAFKYTPDEGKILMRATKEKKDLLVEVVDSGPGIPETDLPFLFERFYKANKGRGDGSGLGLSIAKSFIEAHHGKISAANRPEGGSVFTFTMPSISGNVPLE